MSDNHDPNDILNQKVAPIQFTGGPSAPVDSKQKKVFISLSVAIVLTIIAIMVPILNLALIITMPAAFGLLVYAVYLRYKVIVWMENKAPDWSKIEVPKLKEEKTEQSNDATGVIFKE